MCKAERKLYDYMDDLLGNYPNVDLKDVKSLTKLRKELGIGKYRIIDWVDEYLNEKYGPSLGRKIKEKLWPRNSTALTQYKKEELFKLLIVQIGMYYPNNKFEIPSLAEMRLIFKVRRTTVTNWVKEFLEKEFGYSKGMEIFEEIWTSRKEARHIAITHEYLRIFIANRNGSLITTEEEFNSMNENPTARYIRIRCDKNHEFEASVTHIIHHFQWCSRCNQRFCEKIMRLYMEAIFQAKFPEKSLNKAYGIPYSKGGKLRFDGYNGKVNLFGLIYRIAFEYDGFQHDFFPNPFHRTIDDFKRQNENDEKKENIAKEKNTLVIKLKEVDGFNSKTIHLFQREIMRQFFKFTRKKLEYLPIFEYDPYLNSLVPKKDSIDRWIYTDKSIEKLKENSEELKEKKSNYDKVLEFPELREALEIEEAYYNEEYHWISNKVRQYLDQQINNLQESIKEDVKIQSKRRSKEGPPRHYKGLSFITDDKEKGQLEEKSKIESEPIEEKVEQGQFELDPFIEDSESEFEVIIDLDPFMEGNTREQNVNNLNDMFEEEPDEHIIDENDDETEVFDDDSMDQFIEEIYEELEEEVIEDESDEDLLEPLEIDTEDNLNELELGVENDTLVINSDEWLDNASSEGTENKENNEIYIENEENGDVEIGNIDDKENIPDEEANIEEEEDDIPEIGENDTDEPNENPFDDKPGDNLDENDDEPQIREKNIGQEGDLDYFNDPSNFIDISDLMHEVGQFSEGICPNDYDTPECEICNY